MKFKSIFFLFIILCLSACKSDQLKQKQTTEKQAENTLFHELLQKDAKNEFNWKGIYQGQIPCADCEGIIMKVALKEDNSYHLKGYYKGKEDSNFNYEGEFKWEKNSIILISNDSSNYQFLVLEDKIEMLDQSFNRIDSELSYSLEKTD